MSEKKSNVDALVKGLGIAGAAAAAIAGGYFFYGKDGAKKRKNLKAWSIKAKAEIMEKLEKAKDLSEANYHQIIDAVTEKYGKVKNMNQEEVQMFNKEIKKHWKDIKKELMPPAKKTAKKAAQKA